MPVQSEPETSTNEGQLNQQELVTATDQTAQPDLGMMTESIPASQAPVPRLSRQARVDEKIINCLEQLESSYRRMQKREPVANFLSVVAERMLRRRMNERNMEQMQNEILQVSDRFHIDEADE